MIKKIMGALAIVAGLSSCGRNAYQRAEQYMQDRLQSELNEVKVPQDPNNYHYFDYNAHIATQSKLDSVAYRDVFMATQAVNDSSKVVEFNKIAQQNRANNLNVLDSILANHATVKEYKEIQEKSVDATKNSSFRYEYRQHKIDSLAYRKFFEKYNLLDAKTLKMFNKVTKQIKP